MIHLAGKGIFIHKVINAEKGDNARIVDAALDAGLSHVLIKIADGASNYNVSAKDLPGLVDQLQSEGIDVYGWHYVYGQDPVAEAKRAIARLKQFNLDGYVVNAEAEYKNRPTAAGLFMGLVRDSFPYLPMALSSYRYPSLHPEFPWRQFLEPVDVVMPQVYWMQATNAGEQLRRTWQEYVTLFARLGFSRPIIPTGAAFQEHGWRAQPAEVRDFLQTAQGMDFKAVSFWEWWYARERCPDLWPVIADFDYGHPVEPSVEERVAAALDLVEKKVSVDTAALLRSYIGDLLSRLKVYEASDDDKLD